MKLDSWVVLFQICIVDIILNLIINSFIYIQTVSISNLGNNTITLLTFCYLSCWIEWRLEQKYYLKETFRIHLLQYSAN